MRQYRDVLQKLLTSLDRWELTQDLLSKIAQGTEDHLSYVSKIAKIIDVDAPNIKKDKVLAVMPALDEWMQEMIHYKEQCLTPQDPLRARKIMAMAPSYRIIEGKLFKLSFGGPMLRCLTRAEVDKVITEIHEGIVSDNKQFDNQDFARFCAYYGVEHIKVAVAYPQANGQVENAERTILDGIKKRVEATGST
ncbi:PREDICTED: uncharacterized protein LOC109147193 [Ipomoea nil]|uniref:uncharacterized protein LOC109147193 n=1 Tax=Ipomoea nil TaxID=35883 RepID=UPI000901C5D5|nr:PREDICTED: uncharacterized protein LOC109147193 [Ipomoea nil]